MVINLILPQLWEKHCHKDFRNKQREEMESWREMYERCTYEREEKLDQLKVRVRIILVSGSNPSLLNTLPVPLMFFTWPLQD